MAPVTTVAVLTVMVISAMAAVQPPAGPVSPQPNPRTVVSRSDQRVEDRLGALIPAYTKRWSEKITFGLPPILMAQAVSTPNAQQRLRQVQHHIEELESPYHKWINEDVLYVITNEEKQAFTALTTDEEREKFIEQFWERRDPTPGTPENEFKEEHYRRIAYSNEHFTTGGGLLGWRSDRGRIYITFGPPDEVESHPVGNPPAIPSEQWRYRYIAGIGSDIVIDFVDPAKTGEFRMTLDPAQTGVEKLAEQAKERINIGASVRAIGGNIALISIPLNFYGDHAVNVYGRLENEKGTQKMGFEESVKGPAPLYTRLIPVKPGSYRITIVVRDTAANRVGTEDLVFEMK